MVVCILFLWSNLQHSAALLLLPKTPTPSPPRRGGDKADGGTRPQNPSSAAMDNSDFSFLLSVDRSLRSALPYGGLPGKDSPQMAFFDAASEGDVPRLRGERALRRSHLSRVWPRVAHLPSNAALHLLGFWFGGNGDLRVLVLLSL